MSWKRRSVRGTPAGEEGENKFTIGRDAGGIGTAGAAQQRPEQQSAQQTNRSHIGRVFLVVIVVELVADRLANVLVSSIPLSRLIRHLLLAASAALDGTTEQTTHATTVGAGSGAASTPAPSAK